MDTRVNKELSRLIRERDKRKVKFDRLLDRLHKVREKQRGTETSLRSNMSAIKFLNSIELLDIELGVLDRMIKSLIGV